MVLEREGAKKEDGGAVRVKAKSGRRTGLVFVQWLMGGRRGGIHYSAVFFFLSCHSLVTGDAVYDRVQSAL